MLEFDGLRKNGDVFPVEACLSGWQGTDGIQYGAILRDISVRKREAERIRYLAEYDSLTGLANRNTLQTELDAMIATAEKTSGEVALLVVGLDDFQQINDMLGHACGDQVLCAVSKRLNAEIDGAGIVARLSGDEFAIAIPCADMSETVAQLSERIALTFEHAALDRDASAPRQGQYRRGHLSVGGGTADELLSNSHLAFCRAKATRRGGHVLFEKHDQGGNGIAPDARGRIGARRRAQ